MKILTFLIASVVYGQAMDVAIERGVKVMMRDGTALRADIYRPKAEGRYPVILQRTPYNKAGGGDFGMRAAAAGYVAIIQDVRGRYTSEGEWYPFKWESQDGFDTVEWAASLPYANGKVGMWGGSYVGATQMLAAIAHPPHLAGICPVVTASNYHSNWTYQGGAFEQWFNESWTSGLAQDTLNRKIQADTNAMEGAWTLPLNGYPLFNVATTKMPSTEELAPYFLDWLAHPNYDEYWKKWSIEEHWGEVQVPALHVAAWYDIFQGGSVRNYVGLKEHAGNEAARRGQRLLVVIGGHAGGGRKIGDVDFGEAAAQFEEGQVTLDWYDFLFKGVQNQFAKKAVRIFVMGANEWRDEDDWPLQRAKSVKYFLNATKGANSLRGDGMLSKDAPGSRADAAAQFTYDPANPVATTGGPLCCDGLHLAAGPRDQRAVEAREDVLVYSTPALGHDTEVTGPVTLNLWVKSTAVDTDFTAKLVDVWPNGFAQNLTEGIVRARYRDSAEKAELLTPGEVYEMKVDLWSTSNVFKKGHRIRLEVSSSNFPRFDRNLNTGEMGAGAMRSVTAVNTVLQDAGHASALVLPVVE